MSSSADGRTQFPRPPLSVTDQRGRELTIEAYDDALDPLMEMYGHFGGTSQSQGLPPRTDHQKRTWLKQLLAEGLNVVARLEATVVGHAVLLPYDDTSELAIFVRPEDQSLGIGTALIRGLLGYGQENGLEHVWLSVSRDNRIAMRLYRSAGFETRDNDRGEFEMERNL